MTTPANAPNAKVERTKRLLLDPKTEWPVIAAEPTTANAVFTGWAVPLAAIGPVAGVIGGLIYSMPLSVAIGYAVVYYLLSLAGTWVMAKLVDALAPTFGAAPDPTQAMKIAVYSAIPGWLAGVFQILPGLGILAIIGLYGLYLLFIGLPIVMKPAADKAVPYFVTLLIASLIVFIVIGSLTTAIVVRSLI